MTSRVSRSVESKEVAEWCDRPEPSILIDGSVTDNFLNIMKTSNKSTLAVATPMVCRKLTVKLLCTMATPAVSLIFFADM